MNYILLDLEWNQCPTGKQDENPALPFEIVEIGAIKLNDAREDIGHFSELIRPTLYTRLHFRTQEMLHIPAAELSRARLFPEVFADFIAWCGEDYRFCTSVSYTHLDVYKRQSISHLEPDERIIIQMRHYGVSGIVGARHARYGYRDIKNAE